MLLPKTDGAVPPAAHSGEAMLVGAERGEGIAILRQSPEQIFVSAQAATDTFNEIVPKSELLKRNVLIVACILPS